MKGKRTGEAVPLNHSTPNPAIGNSSVFAPREKMDGHSSRIHLASSYEGQGTPPESGQIGSQPLQSESMFAYQLLSLHARDILLILSLDGQIVEANEAAISAYGYDRGTLLSKHISDLRVAREAGRLAQQLREARESGVRFETVHRRSDGSEFPAEVVSSAGVLCGERFLVSVVRDISDRKRAEEQLERQASLLDLSAEAIFAWYVDGGITYWNKGAERLYGFASDEACGKVSHDLLRTVHPLSLSEFVERLRSERSWMGELQQTTKAGRELIVESRHQVLVEPDGRLLVLESNRDITDRKQVEASLRISEERYRALAHATSQIVWVTNDSGLGRESQEGWEAFTGLDSHGWEWLKAIHPEDRERTESVWLGSVETGEPYHIEHRLRRHDGQYRKMQAHGVPVRDASGQIREWIGTHTDITERKDAELALAQSEEKLRMSLDAAQMGTWDWDIVTGELVWDDRCKALFDLEGREPMTYEAFIKAIDPEDRERVKGAVELALEHDATYDVEMRVSGRNATVRWIRSKGRVLRDAAGTATRMSGCALDITEKKQNEEALQESEERFRLTFDQAAVGITHVAPDGRWLRVNRKLCEITGYSREQLLKTDFQNITHPDDLAADLEQAQRLLAGEIDHYAMEKRYVRPDGSTVWVDLSVSLMRRPDGSPTHFISIVTDISSRKVVETALQERQNQLEEAQRVGGLGSWTWEPAEDRVTWSKELCQIAGLDPAQPAPCFKDLGALYTEESWLRLQGMVEESLQHGRGYESDLEMIRPDGSHRWTAIRAEVELDARGTARRLRGTVLDISDRKRAEEALRRAHAELEVRCGSERPNWRPRIRVCGCLREDCCNCRMTSAGAYPEICTTAQDRCWWP